MRWWYAAVAWTGSALVRPERGHHRRLLRRGYYDIGEAGVPWGEAERAAWRQGRARSRSYDALVLRRMEALTQRVASGSVLDVVEYGAVVYGEDRYPVLAALSKDWDPAKPSVLVTGGVHGYETSGVMGALQFIEAYAASGGAAAAAAINVCVAPCVSPWAFERVERWNADAVDVNRSFRGGGEAQESRALTRLVAAQASGWALHVDLHETTDTDETEFRQALAARDGRDYEPDVIPDGFYLCGDARNPQLAFQAAVIVAVRAVTHIAPADARGDIIGSPILGQGIITYDYKDLGLCGGLTGAPLTTTTEVYPDSPTATDDDCNTAQLVAITAAIDFLLEKRRPLGT